MAVSKELLEKLDQWHEENKHREIVREIGELPEELRQDYGLPPKTRKPPGHDDMAR